MSDFKIERTDKIIRTIFCKKWKTEFDLKSVAI